MGNLIKKLKQFYEKYEYQHHKIKPPPTRYWCEI